MIKRRAFTLTEIAISILILGVMAAGIALNANTSKQTAKNEAERIAAVINRLIEYADRTHSGFWFTPENNNLYVLRKQNFSRNDREKLDFKVSAGCSFSALPSANKGFGYNIGDEDASGYVNVLTSKTPSVTVKVSTDTNDSDAKKFTLAVTGAGTSPCYIYLLAE